MNREKALNYEYVMTAKEIRELGDYVYRNSTSLFPISTFYNDIRDNTDKLFDKNQAYKDLWLIVDYFKYLITRYKRC